MHWQPEHWQIKFIALSMRLGRVPDDDAMCDPSSSPSRHDDVVFFFMLRARSGWRGPGLLVYPFNVEPKS